PFCKKNCRTSKDLGTPLFIDDFVVSIGAGLASVPAEGIMRALLLPEFQNAMWFRNLLVYRLTQNVPFDAETLEAALAAKPARPCASQELSTYGFVAPLGKGADAPLVHASQGFLLLATRKEERILPGSVVKDALKEKVDEIENEQMRKVYKKEREQLKDDIIQAFLPRAFIRKSGTFAAIAPSLGLILVDSSSPKRAEDLLSTLREAIGSLPVRPLT